MFNFQDEYLDKMFGDFAGDNKNDLSESLKVALIVYSKDRIQSRLLRKLAICEYVYKNHQLALQYYEEEVTKLKQEGIVIPSFNELQKLMVLQVGELSESNPYMDEIDLIEKIREKHFIDYLKNQLGNGK